MDIYNKNTGHYIIRLDDACPTMNHENWRRIEKLLDRYKIKPIVGVIPDNMDSDFKWEKDQKFWEHVRYWQKKGWCIALHGLHHKYTAVLSTKNYFQKCTSRKTEFSGISLDDQRIMIHKGIKIMRSHNIFPECFYAPSHTFDSNTVSALHEEGIHFISDGYALYPYKKSNMIFIPSICNSPFPFPIGIFTYVFHPSFMKEGEFNRLKKFLEYCGRNCITFEDAILEKNIKNRQGLFGMLLENIIYIIRVLKNNFRK